jgi:SAM-dependent methyltransferase
LARRIGSELRILRVYRDANEVAASLAARNGMPRELATRIWADHQYGIERDAAGLALQTIRHDAILHDPASAFTAMGAFCGLAAAGDRARAAVAIVDPELWHHRGPAVTVIAPAVPPVVVQDVPRAEPRNLGRVLIVMRTRWRLHMLPRALRSVLAQTYPHWFLQVVNDGGPPHLVESEIAPYRHLLDGRLGILHRDRQYGMEAASNAGIASGPGEFIAIHDDDDSWSPEFLERMIARLSATGGGAAVSRCRLVREAWNGREYALVQMVDFGPETNEITAADLAGRNAFPPIALLCRRSMFEAVGPYHEGLPALGDWQFNKRLADREPIDVVPESLAFWHLRDASDHAPNSPRLDHWRAEAFVTAWPDPAPLPEFFSQARQVRLYGGGSGLAMTADGVTPSLPAGLYLIHFPLAGGCDSATAAASRAFWYRTTATFTRGQSLPLTAGFGSPAAVILNAAEPILELGISVGSDDVQPLSHAAVALRLGNAIPSLNDFAGPPRLPDVLCIGAQRSGTTWLHAALQSHPQVWRCPIKEFHQFSWDGTDERVGEFRQQQAAVVLQSVADGATADAARAATVRMALCHGFPAAHSWEHYAAVFESAPRDQIACDFTPAYATLDEEAVAEILRVMPDIRVIFIMRDPVARTLSGGLHQLSRDGVVRPTESQLREACESTANVLRTDYLRTLDVWERHLRPGRLLVLFHDDIASDPDGVLARVCVFLGIAVPGQPLVAGELSCNAGLAGMTWPELARVKAELSRRWLPMLVELEHRFGEPVRQWRLAAESRIRAVEAAQAGAGAGRDHSVQSNLAQWDLHDPWSQNGDEWDGQARGCGVAYDEWKAGLLARYLPLFPGGGTLLEIGPGHGRWSEPLIDQAGLLVLCDISANCLDACRQRLTGRGRLRTWLSQAADLPRDLTAGVDGVWSYDCLVHVGPDEFSRYVDEISRVLRPGGVAVIHHADRGSRGLLSRVANWFRRRLEGIEDPETPQQPGADHGWRSPVSRADVRRWARAAGLEIVRQESMWTWNSPRGPLRIGVPRFGDCITVLRRTTSRKASASCLALLGGLRPLAMTRASSPGPSPTACAGG